MTGRRRMLVIAAFVVAMLTITSAVYGASRLFVKGGAVQGIGARAVPGATHNCNVKKSNEADGSTTSVNTTSTTYVDVADMSVTFTAKSSGCALVDFASFAFASGTELMFVHAVANNVECAPGEYQYAANDESFAFSHGANFECPVVSGSNTVKIQFRSFDGQEVSMHRRAMLVWHGP
jgi:hypothetical protein